MYSKREINLIEVAVYYQYEFNHINVHNTINRSIHRERRDVNNMICENCKCKDDCGWYGSYKRIEMEIYTGIGTDNTLGRTLIEVMRENNLEECEYFE